jgi:large subunit ribosomal protein L7/L12
MLELAKQLSGSVTAVMGYRNDDMFLTEEFTDVAAELIIATDDGSVGVHGTVVDAMKEKFGVTGAIAVAGGPAAGGAAAAEVEEKTEFDVVLKDAGSEKIKVIKVVREVVSGLGLKEAKDIVESAPKTIKEAVSKEEAEKIAEQFKAVGATVEIK